MGTPTVAMGGHTVAETAVGAVDSTPAGTTTLRSSRIVHTAAVIVLVAGLALTAVLTLGSRSIHDNNENRLLHQRVREVAAVVTASVPSIQTPLQSAALLARATNADAAQFRGLVSPLITTGRPFLSVSLWSVTASSTPRPLVVVGSAPLLASRPPASITAFFAHVNATTLSINDLLNDPQRRVGYAISAGRPGAAYIAYAEAALPKDRRAAIDKNSAFSDLGYALYLGPAANPNELIASSNAGGILHGRTASVTVPFGNAQLHIVMTPHKELGGTLLARLPFGLGIGGVLLTLLLVALVERLTLQRRHAQRLAHENAALYLDQRSIAQTLQHSLLPDALPLLNNVQLAARYVAGVQGVDVGGDWYDVIPIDDNRVVLVVGDVSGCGLQSATMMASLRFATRAYAVDGDTPAAILSKLSNMINIGRDGHFATLMIAAVDLAAHRVVIANAGHPAPLLVTEEGAQYVATQVGVPIGVTDPKPRTDTALTVPPGATLLLYTDGLIERRGEMLDTGMSRLKDATVGVNGSLESLLDNVLRAAIPDGSDDDTAVLGMRWMN